MARILKLRLLFLASIALPFAFASLFAVHPEDEHRSGWSSRKEARQPAQNPQDESSVESRLRQRSTSDLAQLVMQHGDAARGALLYHNPELTCVRCHEPSDDNGVRLGPAIPEINNEATTEFLIESLLDPSRQITEGFQTETILTIEGRQLTGLVTDEEESDDGMVTLVDPNQDGKQFRISKADIEDRVANKVSAMPDGLVGALSNEQSFYDLVRYLVEIKKGGKKMALQLRPPASFFAVAPLPAYESRIDHRKLIGALDQSSLERGEAIYVQYCARCHGTPEQEGSMPSALRFAEGQFKNGNDPHSMYGTLTHGYGLMVAQRWMVPKQKYDVIHYIRETFLKGRNPEQLYDISNDYLAGLPAGNELGPDPVNKKPWSDMDYGNFLINTYEVGKDGTNIAYKGIAVRLDQGPGGVSQGRHWILYEHDTMRVAAAWSGTGFIDYNGIHFNDRHNIHPRIVGDVHLANDHRPGWAHPETGSFDNDPRVVGRDDKHYGPLPEDWLKYRGLYQFDDRIVLNYTVGDTEVLETPSLELINEQPVFHRNLNLQARETPLMVKVASVDGLIQLKNTPAGSIAYEIANELTGSPIEPVFNGSNHLVGAHTFDWENDLTVAARIRTGKDGTIVCQTEDGSDWVPGGTSLFVRGGRLVFDIGWVGAVTSRKRVNDNQWHDVALVWQPGEDSVRLFIDGKLDRRGSLEPGKKYDDPVVRIGYTSENFPADSRFDGDISNLMVWERALTDNEIPEIDFDQLANDVLASWDFKDSQEGNRQVVDRSARKNHARWIAADQPPHRNRKNLWAIARGVPDAEWRVIDQSLCLMVPAGQQPVNLTIAMASDDDPERNRATLADASRTFSEKPPMALDDLIRGGPDRYPQVLTSQIETMPLSDSDPFAVDFLNHPEDNPWFCRMRLTGIDFIDDDTAVVAAWDGSVWRVTGFLTGSQLRWRRIAHGMFQPLGIRVINERIFVTCRDQLVVLEDLNNDGSTDFYRAFNTDHQVTEHFHEFAMGLQSDTEGNLYYAKSARHALPALVPHHGTLLKVAADGSKTDILGHGFRAANGVCLNPDGTFFVTDQEGHWTPKNRINWVRGDGGFYGNIMGYHDVTDQSDHAMEQPLCWITNQFDRSPGELMWVPDNRWGSLSGSLLNLSYGMGQIFVVPHEMARFDGKEQLQGGMCALPIPLFPTGVMRGRFHTDGHLYCCGMYAWAGNQQKPGGLYRIRHTGNSAWLPIRLSASRQTIAIEFSDHLDPSANEVDRYVIRVWDIRRSANYGSKHLNEQQLEVASVELQEDGKTIHLQIPDLAATRCMEIKCLIRTPGGRELTRTIHNTIHAVKEQ